MHTLSWLMFFSSTLALTLVLSAFSVAANSLQEVDDKELERLVAQEQYVLVLFAPMSDDDESSDLETELASVREDLVDSLNAWVVKAVDSKLKDKYSPNPGPTVIFFRQQTPILYDGPANEDEILETLSLFKEPCVRELSDANFEHLTQASTGATTGDWFVLFVRDECDDCEKLRARWESLACRFKGRINVARMNKDGSGAVTGRRFEITQIPEAIFFRLGKMYRYSTVGKYDTTMSSFITGGYKDVKAESIPLPKTPFDDLIQLCADYLRDYPLLFVLLGGLPIVLGLAFYFLMKSDEKPKTKKKKKAKAKDKEM